MDVDLVKLKLAYDDRINRKIPNPAGVGFISEPLELEQQQDPRGTVVRVILNYIKFTLKSPFYS